MPRVVAYFAKALALRVVRMWPHMFEISAPWELTDDAFNSDDDAMALRILNTITRAKTETSPGRAKAEEMFVRERMCNGTVAAAVGRMGSDAVDAEGALPDALLSSTRWPGADALHGGTGVTANVRAAAEHHRHRGLERTRQPSHGPTTRSVAPTLAARLRAAPEALEARLHADALDTSSMGNLGNLSSHLNPLPPPWPIDDFR
uniref:Uncharacterized protein n=1 Tax=Oryza sativa subsp. japonica TaxID=39947 RepID=Q6YS94_ORYSJ|nr:hypothetical protein [Oryza sativa Japonica Group]